MLKRVRQRAYKTQNSADKSVEERETESVRYTKLADKSAEESETERERACSMNLCRAKERKRGAGEN